MKSLPQPNTATPKPNAEKPHISSDRPAKSLEQDQYGLRTNFIPRLARLALQWPSQDGLVIGLFGAWGIGKTSILNMFRNHVEQNQASHQNVRVASFNPWLYEDTGALITSFFATIAEELNAGDGELLKKAGKALKGIGSFLTAASTGITIAGFKVDAAAISKSLKDGAEVSGSLAGLAELAAGGEKRFEQHRTTAEKALNNLGKKGGRIVVLIDDVDRLNKAELLSMLRLIRTVADLPYMTLIIAMDDERVRDILGKAVSEGYGQGFLDKIVQVPLHVPLPERKAMGEKLVSQLREIFEKMGLNLPQELTPSPIYQAQELDVLLSLIQTPRDLARYVNGLRTLLLTGDAPDVHPTDAALIEALRIFHPDVYDRVRRHKRFLTKASASLVSAISERMNSRDREAERLKRAAELDLLVRGTATALESRTEGVVRTLLHLLFGDVTDPTSGKGDEGETAARKIASNDFFDNYFFYEPPKGSVSRREVETLLAKILSHAKTASADSANKIAGEFALAFQGRDESAMDRMAADLGYGFKSVPPEELERIGMGIIAASEQLQQDMVAKLLARVLTHATDVFRRREETEGFASNLSRRLLKAALENARLDPGHIHSLLEHARKHWLSPEHFRDLSGDLLQGIDNDLRAGILFQDLNVPEAADRLNVAYLLIQALGDSTPVQLNVFQTHIVEHVNSHPEHLLPVLYLDCFIPNGSNIPVLISHRRPPEEARTRLQARLGDYEKLRSAFEYLQAKKINFGEYNQLVEHFGKVLMSANTLGGPSPLAPPQ